MCFISKKTFRYGSYIDDLVRPPPILIKINIYLHFKLKMKIKHFQNNGLSTLVFTDGYYSHTYMIIIIYLVSTNACITF